MTYYSSHSSCMRFLFYPAFRMFVEVVFISINHDFPSSSKNISLFCIFSPPLPFSHGCSSWIIVEAMAWYYSSSSSDVVVASYNSTPPKYLAKERSRRAKVKEKLFALRSVVPNITKVSWKLINLYKR